MLHLAPKRYSADPHTACKSAAHYRTSGYTTTVLPGTRYRTSGYRSTVLPGTCIEQEKQEIQEMAGVVLVHLVHRWKWVTFSLKPPADAHRWQQRCWYAVRAKAKGIEDARRKCHAFDRKGTVTASSSEQGACPLSNRGGYAPKTGFPVAAFQLSSQPGSAILKDHIGTFVRQYWAILTHKSQCMTSPSKTGHEHHQPVTWLINASAALRYCFRLP